MVDPYRPPRLRALWLGVIAAALACGLVACGSSQSGSEGAADGGGTGGKAAGAARLASFEHVVPAPALPALPKTPPTGVKVDLLVCNIPGCGQIFSSNAAAAKALGWSLKTISWNLAGGPSSLNVAFAQAIQDDPDYIIWIDAFPHSTIDKSLTAAKAAGIGLIGYGGAMGPPLLNCLGCENQYRGVGATTMKIAQATTKDPNVAVVLQPGLAGPTEQLEGAQAQAKAAGGTVAPINISTSNTQQQNDQAVVSYLQRHPQTQYVVTPIDAWAQGLPTALKQAGLAGHVKLILGLMSIPADIALITSGQAYAGVAAELQMGAYRALDTVGGDAAHLAIPKSLVDPVGWQQVVTKANATSLDPKTLQAPTYEQAFFRAWHVR